jgi:RNA polymerase sigma factor (sigma-70 family)
MRTAKVLKSRKAGKVKKGKSGRALRVIEGKKSKKEVKSKSKTKIYTCESKDVQDLILTYRENGRKLARSLLRKWRVRLPAEEIDSIVDLTLCEAGSRFCKKHGASFMTFFFYHLRGNLVRTIASATKASSLVVAYAKTAGVDVSEWATNGEDAPPVISELAVYNEKSAVEPESLLIKKEKIEACQSAIGRLDKLEQEILTRSYGDDEALIDIAHSLGYSRCHVSRVKKKALQQLKGLLSKNEAISLSILKDHKPSLKGAGKGISRKIKRRRSVVVEIRKKAVGE